MGTLLALPPEAPTGPISFVCCSPQVCAVTTTLDDLRDEPHQHGKSGGEASDRELVDEQKATLPDLPWYAQDVVMIELDRPAVKP
jgi:hypothetical protein